MISLGKRGRGVDPAVLSYLQATLQVPGVGDVHYVVKVDSQYYSWLRDEMKVHSSKIHFDVPAGIDALTANRNDVLLVYPGTYTGTGAAPLAWNKDFCHLVATGAPRSRAVTIRTISDSGVFAIYNTGDNCQFHNMSFQQWGSNAACLTAVKEAGKYNLYKGVHMMGDIRSEAATGSGHFCSLHLDTTVAYQCEGAMFEDCIIGDCGGIARTGDNKGVILFGPTGAVGAAKEVEFRGCKVFSRSQDAEMSAVRIAASSCVDRLLLFRGCAFYNFYDQAASLLTEVFDNDCSTQHRTILMDCIQVGWTNWQDSNGDYNPWIAMPSPNAGGGIGTAAT